MQRRKFMQQGILAGGSLLSASVVLADRQNRGIADEGKPFQCNYGIHDGMFKNHAGNDFVDQIKFAHSFGFRSIEDNGMMSRTPAEQSRIGDTLAKLGMTMGVFVNQFDTWPVKTSMTSGNKEWRDKFLQYCKDSIEVAKRCHAKWITVVPGNYDRSLSEGFQTANVIDCMRRGAAILEPHGLVMVMEPLSDTPDLFLRRSDQTYAICKAVNSPAVKILFDMYHMQRNQGDMIANIDKAWDEIGYRDVYGMEHGNAGAGKEGELALIKAYREADSF
jgi:hydroxypyruvate isomerase